MIRDLLIELMLIPGLAGHEGRVASAIAETEARRDACTVPVIERM